MTQESPVAPMPQSGLERLCASLAGPSPAPLEPALMARVRRAAGLLTHPASVTRDFTSGVEALLRAGAGLKALFGPEHGVRGEAAAGGAVASGVDRRSGLPVFSLYGGSPSSHAPSREMLAGVEVLLIDLQDIGARFYTYTSTLSLCMAAAAEAGVPVVVLDRPNPIGVAIEGPLLRPEFASFVGLHPLPVRHGCSLGELARLFHQAYAVGEDPAVVPFLRNEAGTREAGDGTRCEREVHDSCSLIPHSSFLIPHTFARWIPPSPNIPTPLSALVYPGIGLLEGSNVSEGRGTTKPFEWLGAPWLDVEALTERLRAEALPGVIFRPVHFTPTASKWAGEVCAGVQVHVVDDRAFRPVRTGVAILAALRHGWPDQFRWIEANGRFKVDRLTGTDATRQQIDAGVPAAQIAAGWAADEAAFAATCEPVRLYR